MAISPHESPRLHGQGDALPNELRGSEGGTVWVPGFSRIHMYKNIHTHVHVDG